MDNPNEYETALAHTGRNNQTSTQWLTLKQASDFLGVHYTTLRTWADRGEIRVFRTPGGHRRFSAADLRRFLEERAGQSIVTDSDAFVNVAVGRVREEIQKIPHDQMRWHYPLDAHGSDERRRRGRQLFALAIAFVVKPKQRNRLLEEGRQLGWDYGHEAAASQVGLVETGRAVQFFRSQLMQVLHNEESTRMPDADDFQIQRLIDHFLDEMLYAVLEGYEQGLRREQPA
jgi:excisionase family DNA binding protein